MIDMHSRAHIRLTTQTDLFHFINILNTSDDSFDVENFYANHVVNARSAIGMLYMMGEYGEEMYLVNRTNDGVFPSNIDVFRM